MGNSTYNKGVKSASMKKFIHPFLLTLFCAIILATSLRGIAGNPTSSVINQPEWKELGPFELSPERGRFALALSIIENNSFFYSLPIARFATPDLGFINGNYVSLFAPGVSFLVIPGFWLGRIFGAGQVGAYAVISLFAIANVFLLRNIAIRLGANPIAATLGSLIFIFATPAFAYGVNLYQHHISTFLILLSIYSLMSWSSIISVGLIWFLFAASIPVDYPNVVLMAPIAIAALGKFILSTEKEGLTKIGIKFLYVFSFLGVVIPLAFFMWFNYYSYGNPLQFSGTVAGVRAIDQYGKPTSPQGVDSNNIDSYLNPAKQQKSSIKFFQTRRILDGFYIHLVSPDRGIIYYTPVVLFGVIGFFLALKNKIKLMPVLVGIIGANLLLYSMWGDPWGGWAFGSRYLIPSYAILSIFIALLLTYWRKKIWFLIPFILVAFYSIAVNTLGAITTSAIPPQVEVLNLEKLSGTVQKYTYDRNWDFLVAGNSKSFVYQTFLKDYLTPVQFYQILTVAIFLVVGGILSYYAFLAQRKGHENV